VCTGHWKNEPHCPIAREQDFTLLTVVSTTRSQHKSRSDAVLRRVLRKKLHSKNLSLRVFFFLPKRLESRENNQSTGSDGPHIHREQPGDFA